jgi:hypothetical protein
MAAYHPVGGGGKEGSTPGELGSSPPSMFEYLIVSSISHLPTDARVSARHRTLHFDAEASSGDGNSSNSDATTWRLLQVGRFTTGQTP